MALQRFCSSFAAGRLFVTGTRSDTSMRDNVSKFQTSMPMLHTQRIARLEVSITLRRLGFGSSANCTWCQATLEYVCQCLSQRVESGARHTMSLVGRYISSGVAFLRPSFKISAPSSSNSDSRCVSSLPTGEPRASY